MSEQTDAPDYSQRVAPSYLVGVYLAVNAVRDLYLMVEGPDCAHMKTQYVQGNHDWMSTLTSVSGTHRVANTAIHPDNMSGSREGGLCEALTRLAAHDHVPALAVTSLPMAFITGADYERLVAEVAEQSGKPMVHIPGKSLSGDWLDGYAETLHAFASQLDLSGGELDPRKVAIVGYLHDRNEGDHEANLDELRRLVTGLDLELCSVWLCGGDVADLFAARDAGTIISLPYGRRAARRLARRTGAKLLETELPLGLPATEAWVRQLGEALDRREQAEALLDRELSVVVPRLEWVIPYVFQTRRVGYVGDPHMLPGLASYLEVLGASVTFAVIIDPEHHTSELPADLGADLLVYPKMTAFTRFLSEHLNRAGVDALVTNSHGAQGHPVASLELGFPSMYRHALYQRPFLGFGGALALADSLANAMRAHELRMSHAPSHQHRGDGPPGDGERPPEDGERPPKDGERPPEGVDGERPQKDGERPPEGVDGERPPKDGERPPEGVDGERTD